ncbi:MAG: hypothetical protein PV340_01365 [Wolbachia sp.]|nr:hypothetical protein [Wolbachia sp.]MDD9336331.1 hypothetical protein [Wolbachia sp.]
MPNIKVVDFNEIDLDKRDFTLPVPQGEFKIPEPLKYRYDEELVKLNIVAVKLQKLEFFAKKIPF